MVSEVEVKVLSEWDEDVLYKNLGFEPRETNCYRHHLDPVPEPW